MLSKVWRFMIVCSRGVVGCYGGDLTPRIFYENFIAVMVNIDADDGYQTRRLSL